MNLRACAKGFADTLHAALNDEAVAQMHDKNVVLSEMVLPSSPVQVIASLREGAWLKQHDDDRLLRLLVGVLLSST